MSDNEKTKRLTAFAADGLSRIVALQEDNARLRRALTGIKRAAAHRMQNDRRDLHSYYFHTADAALNTGKEVMPDGTSKVPNNDIGPGDQDAVAGAAEDFETQIIDGWIARNEPAVPLVSADAILHGLGLMLDGKHIPVRDFYAGPEGLFKLKGDTLGLRCATTGCGQHVSLRLERDGVGSDYCEPCGLKAVQA
jgi:hypothetical protein